MSYSFIKTVFPQYQSSMNYNALPHDGSQFDDSKAATQDNSKAATQDNSNKVPLPLETSVGAPLINTPILETYTDTKTQKHVEHKDNLRYYNLPRILESFDGKNEISDENSNSCDVHTKHILSCASCKRLLMKQFNIENDRLKTEEMMEMFSYMMFGLFILLLIDNIQKRKM